MQRQTRVPQLGREIAAGSIAAGFTASLFNPLEVVKTRLQVQEEVIATASRTGRAKPLYDGFGHALRKISREDGLLRFWQHGFVGFVFRDFVYSGIRIGAYPSVRGWYSGDCSTDSVSLSTRIAAGMTTGAVGSAIANPLDVVRVRTSSEAGLVCARTGLYTTGLFVGSRPSYNNSAHAIWTIARVEGVRQGLWKGATATMMRATVLSGSQLASYDHSKVKLKGAGIMDEGLALHVVSAIISGLVATTCCNPPDVVKSHLMLARAEGGRNATQRGPLGVTINIWRERGLLGFFRGWLPAYARAGPAYFIQMPIVEYLRLAFGVETL